jgi:hypothetical protein
MSRLCVVGLQVGDFKGDSLLNGNNLLIIYIRIMGAQAKQKPASFEGGGLC